MMLTVYYVTRSMEGFPDGYRVARCLSYPAAIAVLRALLDCCDQGITWVKIEVARELQEG